MDRLRTAAREVCVLAALEDGPKSCNEVSRILIDQARAAWADRHGYEIEWGSDSEPLGARLLAYAEAEENGCVYLLGHEVYPVMRRLERKRLVTRISLDGHRPILWRAEAPF